MRDRKFYFYQSGFDPAFARNSVGLLMMGVSIQDALEEGALEYDLLHGDEEYKAHWSRQSRELVRWEVMPPGIHGWVSQSVVELGRSAKRWMGRGGRS
jgi:CelD/BcsL family acetyltransferase involved in cellulose biosynthesis